MSDQGESAQRFDASTGDVQEHEAAEGSQSGDLFRPPTPRATRLPWENAPTYDPAKSQPPASGQPISGASDGYGLDDVEVPAAEPVWESAAFDAAFDAAFGTDPAERPAAPTAPAPASDEAFDGMESGGGYTNYAGVDMSGPDTPAKAGVPSSGNWQMPEWMREEAPDGGFVVPGESASGGGGKGKLVLVAGAGVLVAALIAAGAVFLLKGNDKGDVSPSTPPKGPGTPTTQQSTAPKPTTSSIAAPPNAKLPKFTGIHGKAAGRVNDTFTGLNYPRLAAPWQVPSKKSGLSQLGWSQQQILVTEKHGSQLWYGQLMSGLLSPAEQQLYGGPGTEKAAAIAYEKSVETRLYGFPHKSHALASQAVDLPGRGGKGWLVATNLTYHRQGIKATGEVLTVAIIDTGKSAPAVLLMSIPDTSKKLWPDINFVVDSLKRAS
jgi:hypothetical protein